MVSLFRNAIACLGVATALTACATPKSVTRPIQTVYTPDAFTWCGGPGCRSPREVSLTEREWRDLTAPLRASAIDAPAERAALARAVARAEQIAGAKTGTEADEAGTKIFNTDPNQLDCFSEASNTSNLIGLFSRAGLLRFHEPDEPVMRGYAFGTPSLVVHATASMRETATSERWAVDSWFFDSGHEPAIVPVSEWRAGYRPEGGAIL